MCFLGTFDCPYSGHHAGGHRKTLETQACGLYQEASNWFAGREVRVQNATVGHHEEVPTDLSWESVSIRKR